MPKAIRWLAKSYESSSAKVDNKQLLPRRRAWLAVIYQGARDKRAGNWSDHRVRSLVRKAKSAEGCQWLQ